MQDPKVISPTKQEYMGETYYLCGYYFQHKGKRLHRVVWEENYGPIPKKYHVHHVDHDRTNNALDNLALISAEQHARSHASEPGRKEQSRKTIEVARAKASEWHGSDAGRDWHRKHMAKIWQSHEQRKAICLCCGQEFSTNAMNPVKFCSNNCKSKYRRDSGVDNEIRICKQCGGQFTTNKYSKIKFCGKECAHDYRWG